MKHHDRVLKDCIDIIEAKIEEVSQPVEAYIVQNVYGKMIIYIDTQEKQLTDQLKEILNETIGNWLGSCEAYGDNYFVKAEIERWKEKSNPLKEHIWVFEKYLTNVYWDGERSGSYEKSVNAKLVSFYSFKGGVGRTTSMIMTAISLALQGKKVVLIDFDLEAPGVSSLFPEDKQSQYGLLDFLMETNAYDEEIRIDEYIYPVGEYCRVNQAGGEIYVMPAYGQVIKDNAELYRKILMRFDLDVPIYNGKITPIDLLLKKVDEFLSPHFIFIDSRAGLHQIGGITLARYSDLAILFFYGSQQNINGMKMVLPILKQHDTPFIMVNSKAPANEELFLIEKKVYLEGAYEAFSLCDEQYRSGEILPDDESADHYPVDIAYNPALEVISSTDQLVRAYENQQSAYGSITNAIFDMLQTDNSVTDDVQEDFAKQENIINAFCDIMSGLQTPAAEDEFATEQDLMNNFYPLKGYSFIYEPRKFLILGQKGVGKTALFSALKNSDYAKALAKYLGVDTEQYEHTQWIVGTARETDYTDVMGLLNGEEQIRAFLYYSTAQILLNNDPELFALIEEEQIKSMLTEPFHPDMIVQFAPATIYSLNGLLKVFNREYEKRGVVITIIYDALDRIVAPKDRKRFVSTLVDLWYMNESTMRNIRSKIFLRKDIYEREVIVSDKVKLKNYSATIDWEYDQLFAMVWKRVVSKSSEVKAYYERMTSNHISEISGLGYIPDVNELENKAMLAALIGVRMGSTKKASTYNWFKNRLADTQGTIVPRSMIDIFEKAAKKETELRDKSGPLSKSIIRPRCFEDVLPEVSIKRVIDLKEEYREYAEFLDQLKDTVQRSPVEETLLGKALMKAGFENPREEIQNLINIGIIKQYPRKQSDEIRYQFPDIYLRGLGLQRMGMK